VLIIGLMIVVGYLVGFRFSGALSGAIGCVAVVTAFGLALSWIFAYVALRVRGAEAAQSAGFVVTFPLVFASSVFVPIATMPDWLQAIAKVSPVTLTADAARSLALTGTPSSLAGALAWVGGILLVFVPLSVRRYRRMG
jgi:ABC-2 type transport system permease protein/oleandomycin transport system permease protein